MSHVRPDPSEPDHRPRIHFGGLTIKTHGSPSVLLVFQPSCEGVQLKTKNAQEEAIHESVNGFKRPDTRPDGPAPPTPLGGNIAVEKQRLGPVGSLRLIQYLAHDLVGVGHLSQGMSQHQVGGIGVSDGQAKENDPVLTLQGQAGATREHSRGRPIYIKNVTFAKVDREPNPSQAVDQVSKLGLQALWARSKQQKVVSIQKKMREIEALLPCGSARSQWPGSPRRCQSMTRPKRSAL